MDRFNKTHCDKCGEKVERGGIYADGGFYHKDTCWKERKREFIANYEWDEYKTFNEDNAICPYCGHEDRDSWELGEDGETTCGRCESEYSYSREVVVKYTTTPREVK